MPLTGTTTGANCTARSGGIPTPRSYSVGLLSFSAFALAFIVIAGVDIFGDFDPENPGLFYRHLLITLSASVVVGIGILLWRQRAVESSRAALLLSLSRHARAQSFAQLGDWELDLLTGETYWSDESYRLLGYTPGVDRASLEAFVQRLHPDERERIQRYLREVGTGTVPAEMDFRALLPDGKARMLRERVEVIRDADGKPLRMVGTMMDVTEQRLAEEALRQSEERFRTLGNSAPVGIFSNDAQGNCTYVNEMGARLCGLPADRLLGMSWGDIIHPEDRERVVSSWREDAAAGRPHNAEFRMLTAGGASTWIASRVQPIRNSACALQGFVGTLVDISEHKRVARMKDDFISTVSHELRTPITAIRGSLKLIAAGVTGPLAPQTQTMVDIANNSCERLIRLVNDILDVGRIESGRLPLDIHPVPLSPLIDTLVETNRAYGRAAGVEFIVENRIPSASVDVDSDRLTQVLTNLLSNAVKFSCHPSTVRIILDEHQGRARVSFADHGPGIPEQFRSRIFQKFSQADSSDTKSKVGTGLGLAISKAILEKLGGDISFETEVGVGTTFHVDLPMRNGTESPTSQELHPGLHHSRRAS